MQRNCWKRTSKEVKLEPLPEFKTLTSEREREERKS